MVGANGFQFWPSVGAVVILLSVLCCLVYFFFSMEHKGMVGKTARGGILVLMVTFGAAFGLTVMGRITLLTERFGGGCRVICPITDPYVVHHGALGAFVSVHVRDKNVREIAAFIRTLEGVTEVYERSDAETQLELPGDRIGDLVVLSGRDIVIGRTPEDHDLSVLEGRLRSHGGRFEDTVPFLVSAPLKPEYLESARNDLRNFDAFDFVCNGIA